MGRWKGRSRLSFWVPSNENIGLHWHNRSSISPPPPTHPSKSATDQSAGPFSDPHKMVVMNYAYLWQRVLWKSSPLQSHTDMLHHQPVSSGWWSESSCSQEPQKCIWWNAKRIQRYQKRRNPKSSPPCLLSWHKAELLTRCPHPGVVKWEDALYPFLPLPPWWHTEPQQK